MWEVALIASGPVMKEIAKNPPVPEGKGGKDSAKKKDKGKEKEKEKPKRKGPLDSVPKSSEEWAVYDCPEEVIEAFKNSMIGRQGIHAKSITKPILTFHYLERLAQYLRELGYNHLALPVLCMMELLSRYLLQSQPLLLLVHLRSAEVCLELSIATGVKFHEEIIGSKFISEDDQAMAREEVALWRERQAVMRKEEQRLQEAITSDFAEAGSDAKVGQTALEQELRAAKTAATAVSGKSLEAAVGVRSHLGKQMGGTVLRDIWTDTAEVLMRQASYQPARQLLHEALLSAQALEDIPLTARLLYLLGKLSFMEGQFGQAIRLAFEAQNIYCGDESFWFDTTWLMIEATFNDYENRNRKRKARAMLVHALNVFSDLRVERPNREGILGRFAAKIEAKLAEVQLSIILDEHQNLMHPAVHEAIMSAGKKYRSSWQQLIRLGFRREALDMMKGHANTYIMIARDCLDDDNQQHEYYLQALEVMRERVVLTRETYHDVITLTSLQDTRGFSLPVGREAAEAALSCAELQAEMLQLFVHQQRTSRLNKERKNSVLRMVDELTCMTPDYTETQELWLTVTKSLCEEALALLVNAHSLTAQIPPLKAKSLMLAGKVLRLSGEHVSPDPPGQWLVSEVLSLRDTGSVQSSQGQLDGTTGTAEAGEATHDAAVDVSSAEYRKYGPAINAMKSELLQSQQLLAQACEVQCQALNLALQNNIPDVVSVCALELAELTGQFEAGAGAQFLALYQSCQASSALFELLLRAQRDPSTSQLAALLHQRKQQQRGAVSAGLGASRGAHATLEALREFQAWKRLEVSPNHLELTKDMPTNLNIILLQHSEDKSHLYAALMDKPKPGQIGEKEKKDKKDKSGGLATQTKARVACMDTHRRLLDALLARWRQHKQNVMTVLLKQEYRRSQHAQRMKMLENLDEELKISMRTYLGDMDKEEAELQHEFDECLEATERYLAPVLQPLHEGLCLALEDAERACNKDGSAPQECVVIIADHFLLELPLEALSAFRPRKAVSVCREISLQMLYNKIKGEDKPEETPAEKRRKAEAKPSRIPGMRDANKKQSKIVPVDRPIPPGFEPVDTMNFRYMVDTHNDCPPTEQNAPVQVLQEILDEYDQQFTPRWLGVQHSEHIPSIGEWEIYLTEGSSFVFYGMERFLSYISPEKISALNLQECCILLNLDLAQTSRSFLRQSKNDVLKSAEFMGLERPVEAVLLSSLAGARCVMSNQWHATLAENADRLRSTMKDMLQGGKTPGQAVRLQNYPARRLKSEVESEEQAEANASSQEIKSPDGSKKSSVASKVAKNEKAPVPEVKPSEPEEEFDQINRNWFNLVCYGMPNFLITQV